MTLWSYAIFHNRHPVLRHSIEEAFLLWTVHQDSIIVISSRCLILCEWQYGIRIQRWHTLDIATQYVYVLNYIVDLV